MIQRMNNVLVKHSKFLFGVITVIIIVSFVWFFTPGADGSLLFSRNSNKVGTSFGETITIKDMDDAAKDARLANLANAFAQDPAGTHDLPEINAPITYRFEVAALLKAAHKLGFAASDKELQTLISADPAFQEDGSFSKAKYDQFRKEYLKKLNVTVEDFENAVRNQILLNKVMSSPANDVTVTDDEIDRAYKAMFTEVEIREITFDAKNFKQDAAKLNVSDEEIKAEYNTQGKYMSLPKTDAVIVFTNYKDAKVEPVADDQVEAMFKALDGKKAKDAIRAELTLKKQTDAAKTQLNEFKKDVMENDAFKKDTVKVLKDSAVKAGFKLAEPNGLTKTSPETVLVSKEFINAITATHEAQFTRVIEGKDSALTAFVTKRHPSEKLPLDQVKDSIRKEIAGAKAAKAAKDAANALRAAVVAEKLNTVAIEAKVKSLKGEIAKAVKQPAFSIIPVNVNAGFITPAQEVQPGVCKLRYIENIIVPNKAPTDQEKAMASSMMLRMKQEVAVQEWRRWLQTNIQSNLRGQD